MWVQLRVAEASTDKRRQGIYWQKRAHYRPKDLSATVERGTQPKAGMLGVQNRVQ